VGERSGFAEAVGSAEAVIAHAGTDALVIATRHDQHGPLTLAALEAGKHVFVEKPLCLTLEELRAIAAVCRRRQDDGTMPVLQVGFNRRFSPSAVLAKQSLGRDPGPLTMTYRVAAGRIPKSHWTQDPAAGGGRIVGEVCHFIDLMQFMCGADPVAVSAMAIDTDNADVTAADNSVMSIRFADGSVGTIGYFAEGGRSVPKERLEVHGAGRTVVLDNFQSVTIYGDRKSVRRCPGKGHAEEVKAFLTGIRDGEAPIAASSLLATTLATLRLVAAMRTGGELAVDPGDLRTDG
jgi:predicted dehydrogenase